MDIKLTQLSFANFTTSNIVIEIDYKNITPYLYGPDEPWHFVHNIFGSPNVLPHEKTEIVDIKPFIDGEKTEKILIKHGARFNMLKYANSVGLNVPIVNQRDILQITPYDDEIPFFYLRAACLRPEYAFIENGLYYLTKSDFPILKSIERV
jgi:hypothetical protein